ncbi:hypothetical protein U27_06591 [Candidatus Vecturithrix granuli]|uniref:Protein argonaute n=1 Tax=Vecturithrix granuli TaxID=1499967 RepID=A0A081C4V1_VECG1|nr:hypothetical protein U27_06591 [Candidatus Vecturithrix granuli]
MREQQQHPNNRAQPEFLTTPRMKLTWLPEPELLFANSHRHINPKIGISLFGPKSLNTPRHKSEIHIGFVGEARAIEHVRQLMADCSKGVMAEDIENGSLPFSGNSEELGYRFKITFSEDILEKITNTEKEHIFEGIDSEIHFNRMVDLIEEKVNLVCEKDHPLDYIFIVLTEEVFERLKVVYTADPLTGEGSVKRNFRRALKARLMKYQKPIQIIRESTTGYTDDKRDLQDLATRAWNLFTGMYFKVGGLPWGPTGLQPSTCFVGISFFKPLGQPNYMRASIAQAFDENGDGLILRGQKFRWDDELGKSPHMPENLAKQLIGEVLSRYQSECKHLPRRVVIHKSSRFETGELDGFKRALTGISEYDLVTVGTTGDFRLFRSGEYPPLRGTIMNIGDNYFLYTTGYIPEIGKYPHGHVPAPLRIVDHYGDTIENQLLQELFVLTKMNWNTANVDGAYPITLQFARLVGDILREIPENQEPNPKYIYYM